MAGACPLKHFGTSPLKLWKRHNKRKKYIRNQMSKIVHRPIALRQTNRSKPMSFRGGYPLKPIFGHRPPPTNPPTAASPGKFSSIHRHWLKDWRCIARLHSMSNRITPSITSTKEFKFGSEIIRLPWPFTWCFVHVLHTHRPALALGWCVLPLAYFECTIQIMLDFQSIFGLAQKQLQLRSVYSDREWV